MTMRLTFGIDPGLSGAIATLIDGEPGRFLDMPLRESGKRTRPSKVPGEKAKVSLTWEVDAGRLATFIRELRAEHPGAYLSASVERVSAAPNAKEGERRQGTSSMFAFGESAGVLRGVLEAMHIPYVRVVPAVWKRSMGLIGTEKDAARLLAIRRFPSMAESLKRKKDGGRADAMLLALWHESQAMR